MALDGHIMHTIRGVHDSRLVELCACHVRPNSRTHETYDVAQ